MPVCACVCVFVSTSQSVLVYDLSCFRSRLCLPYLAEWCWVLAAPGAEPEPTAHCLNGRGLIPLLKAHSSKHHFSKATHAHAALSSQSGHHPQILCVGYVKPGVGPWWEKLLQAPDLISNNYLYHVSLTAEGKGVFAHTVPAHNSCFFLEYCSKAKYAQVHFPALIYCTNLPCS